MENDRDLYFHMAHAAEKAIQILIQAEQDCEEDYLSFSDSEARITEIRTENNCGEEST